MEKSDGSHALWYEIDSTISRIDYAFVIEDYHGFWPAVCEWWMSLSLGGDKEMPDRYVCIRHFLLTQFKQLTT